MSKALFLTYNGINNIVAPVTKTANDNVAMVITGIPFGDMMGLDPIVRKQKMIELIYSYDVLQEHDPDYLVIYLGDHGLEEAFKMASMLYGEHKEVHFVNCDCQEARKNEMSREYLVPNAHFHPTPCGGEGVMRALLNQFLATGSIRSFP